MTHDHSQRTINQRLINSVKIYLKNNHCVEKEKDLFERYGASFGLTQRL